MQYVLDGKITRPKAKYFWLQKAKQMVEVSSNLFIPSSFPALAVEEGSGLAYIS